MEKEIWILIYLEDGYFEGVEKVFDNLKEVTQYVHKQGFVLADDNEFSYYGTVDYVEKDRPDRRYVIQQEVVFIQ